jgi:plastocyanin
MTPGSLSGSFDIRLGRMRRATLLGGAVLGLALSAGSAMSTDAPGEHVVTMGNMSFGKMPTGVKVGDAIVWVNRDTVPHTATARDKSFDVRVLAGQTGRMTVKKAGTIPFYCIYHAAMRGSLTVAAQ